LETQINSIREQLILLAELQQTDLEIERIEKELAGVQNSIDALDDQLSEVKQQVEECETRLADLRKQYRSDEDEVKKIEEGIQKSNGKLRSVKTNKEYQSLLKEIDDSKAKANQIEDKMLANLEQIETAEDEMATLKADQADVQENIEKQKAEIHARTDEQKTKLIELQKQHAAGWSDLPSNLQTMYGKAKNQGQGIAVASVIEAVCQVCRMNIPPQLFNELLRLDSLRLCPNCQRIIYPQIIWEKQ
jgi:predicted  nucleic acid-binding Zn-ribbon protein